MRETSSFPALLASTYPYFEAREYRSYERIHERIHKAMKKGVLFEGVLRTDSCFGKFEVSHLIKAAIYLHNSCWPSSINTSTNGRLTKNEMLLTLCTCYAGLRRDASPGKGTLPGSILEVS